MHTPVSIHTYVHENMVVDVSEDEDRSIIFPVQDFHLKQFQPSFHSTFIPWTDDVNGITFGNVALNPISCRSV